MRLKTRNTRAGQTGTLGDKHLRAPVAALCVLLGWAMQALSQSPPIGKVPAVVVHTLYHDYCSVCHGDKGDGKSRASASLDPRPRDFTSAKALTELSRERMILSVREGRPGTAMTPWKTQLTDAQIAAVVDYIRSAFQGVGESPQASRGRRIYAKTCSVCHGDRGAGSLWASANLQPAPRDFSAPATKVELSRERMITSVTHGRPGTAMAGFARQLSSPDIAAVVDYIRTAFMQAPGAREQPGAASQAGHSAIAQAPAVDMRSPMPNGLHGDVAKGKAFYLRNCATCHGAQGDGNGPRAYFINPKPRNFILAQSPAVLNRPAIYAAVAMGRVGTEMPAWSKVLNEQEIADVSEFVFQAYVSSAQAKQDRFSKHP